MVKEISRAQLKSLLEEGADLIDVREEEELKEGMIKGCANWPLSTFGRRKRDISQAKPTIFYCRSGMRSMQAAEIASSWTEQQLFFLNGGFLNYRNDGLAVEDKGKNPHGSEQTKTTLQGKAKTQSLNG